ncbi:MAG TPA: tetratricopeptide repeat protein [Pyrinomonadaceae bacterium]|nr:tetratricopeptide repeat protein [Pyrinomonadaceae bacterium]
MKRNRFTITFICCFVGILLFSLPLAAQSKSDQVKKLKDQAAAAERAKDHRAAADAYAQVLAITPNDAEAYYRKGFAHYSLKENDQAAIDLSQALTKGYKPQLNIYKVRYYVYLEQKNYDAALADIQKGLEITPNDFDFLNSIGEISLERKQYPEALTAFQKASVVSPNNGDLYYNIARVNFAMGDAKAQAAAAESALAKGTRFPGETYHLLADAHQRLRDFPAAIDAYKRAINAKPDVLQAYRNLSEIYRSENRFDDAINVSRQGLGRFVNDGNLYTDLSLYYQLADRPEDAVKAGLSAVQLLPDKPAGYTILCRAYNDTKNYPSAVEACNKALKLKPGDGETLFYLGRAFDLLGDTPRATAEAKKNYEAEATKYYAQAVAGLMDNVQKDASSSESWYLLGNAYFTDNQREKALEAYRKTIDLSPKFAKARYNLGILYTLLKQKTAAVEQYDRLKDVDARLADRLRAEIDRM